MFDILRVSFQPRGSLMQLHQSSQGWRCYDTTYNVFDLLFSSRTRHAQAIHFEICNAALSVSSLTNVAEKSHYIPSNDATEIQANEAVLEKKHLVHIACIYQINSAVLFRCEVWAKKFQRFVAF